jgi:hypothetical protein
MVLVGGTVLLFGEQLVEFRLVADAEHDGQRKLHRRISVYQWTKARQSARMVTLELYPRQVAGGQGESGYREGASGQYGTPHHHQRPRNPHGPPSPNPAHQPELVLENPQTRPLILRSLSVMSSRDEKRLSNSCATDLNRENAMFRTVQENELTIKWRSFERLVRVQNIDFSFSPTEFDSL